MERKKKAAKTLKDSDLKHTLSTINNEKSKKKKKGNKKVCLEDPIKLQK